MYKLLIVDDNKLQINSLLFYLDWKSFGITEIKTAENGKEGLDTFKSFLPDIIITDVVMPEMDGIELTKEIRKLNNDVKFIYISCHEDFSYLKEALDNEVVSYILKPIESAFLKESVSKLIDKIEHDKEYKYMNNLLKESLNEYRKNFFYKLIYSRYIDIEYFKTTVRNLEFDSYKSFAVVNFEPFNTSRRFIDIYNVLSLTEDKLFEEADGMAVVENEVRIIALFMGKRQNDEFIKQIKRIVKNYVTQTKEELKVHLNIGISSCHKSLLDIREMMDEAKSAAENNLILGDDEIGTYDSEQRITSRFNIIEIKEALDELINKYSENQLNLFIDVFLGKDVYLDSCNIKILCVYIYSAIQIILAERNFVNDVFLKKASEIFNSVQMSQDPDIIRTQLTDAIKEMLAFICSGEENDKERLVNAINNHVHRNYSDITSVEQIASALYVSLSYARKIYKEYTGKTIFEEIFTTKMENAKKLLCDPGAKVYDVANAVGYSKRHFVEYFKRYTGLLPDDYKKNVTGKE